MCIAGIRLYTRKSNLKIPGMIYEFVIDLRVKGLLLSDLKLERNFRIRIEMEFFFNNYDLKVSINHSLKKIDRSVDSFQFIDLIRYKYNNINIII